MGVSISEFGYTSATTGRRDHEVHKGHVVVLAIYVYIYIRVMEKLITISMLYIAIYTHPDT
jgi:hypothetical protein